VSRCLSALLASALFHTTVSYPAVAQIFDLATTHDGRHLYLVSQLRQRGSNQFSHAKLFRITETGALELFAQVERRYPEGLGNTSNFYAITAPSVSGDGTLVAYTLFRDCLGGSSCLFVTRASGVARAAALPAPITLAGLVQVSHNGRYLAEVQPGGPFPFLRRTDLRTGEQIRVDGRFNFLARAQAVTDEGRVLVNDGGSMVLWDPGSMKRLPQASTATEAVISSDGCVVVYRTEDGALRTLHVSTGMDRFLAFGSTPSLSAGAKLVLYLAPSHLGAPVQLWLGSLDGSPPQRLTAFEEDITSATLAGLGNVAYAATALGRLLQVDLASGAVRELIAPTPVVQARRGAAVPGSLNWLHGSGLADVSELSLGGLTAPIVAKQATWVAYQIPFEAPLGSVQLQIDPHESPLESATEVTLEFSNPQFIHFGLDLPGAQYLVAAAHEDFRSIVSDSDPALPGEILHFYMTGLGAVDPPVETGAPAPVFRPVYARRMPVCRCWQAGIEVPIEVLFAGLAPGLVGVYQVSIRMPANLQESETGSLRAFIMIQCGRGTDKLAGVPIQLNPQ
jgi:uncharacterized protein (TIGR03437 family)